MQGETPTVPPDSSGHPSKDFLLVSKGPIAYNLFISSFGGTTAGIIFDKTGRYALAFEICLGVSIGGLICIIFANSPMHPSLKNNPGKAP